MFENAEFSFLSLISKLSGIFKKFSLQGIWKKFRHFLRLLPKIGTFLITVVIAVSSLRGVLSKTYLIEPIGIPEVLSRDGLDGKELSGRIVIRINNIRKKALASGTVGPGEIYFGEPMYDGDAAVPDDDIQLFGISINSIKAILRVAFGTESRSISGAILKNNEELEAKIHLSSENELVEIKEKVEAGNLMGAVDRLVDRVAESILYYNDPLLLSGYFMQIGEIDRAEAVADEHIQISRMKILKGYVEIAKDHPDQALQYFKNAEDDGLKEDFNVQFGQGLALSKTGAESDLKQSVDHFSQASRLSSENPSAYFSLGTALMKMHRYEEASEMYKRATSMKKDYSEAYYNLGKISEMKSNKSEAAQYYKKAIDSNRNHLEAKKRLTELGEKF